MQLSDKNRLFNFGDWKDSPNNNFINMTDRELDKMMLNPNFKYYDNHEFHKLKQKCSNNRNFSIFHTNICSLQAKKFFNKIYVTKIPTKKTVNKN